MSNDTIVVEQTTLTDNEELVNLDDVVIDETRETPKELEKEVVNASSLPEKFQGKSVEEVAEVYSNLEKEFGRKNNELGEQRKLIDQLLELKLEEKSTPNDKQNAQKVDVDSLLDDPDRVISDAVANNPVLKEMQENLVLSKREAELKGFEGVHPDWQTVIQTDEFAKWIKESPVREQLFNDANQNYKYDVATELFTLYKGVQGTVVEEAKEIRKKNAKQVMNNAATEKGTQTASTQKIYSRAQLMNFRLRDPEGYRAREQEFYQAYAEGRVR